MAVLLREVLAHAVIREAQPQILTGADLLERPVRWVHSSEIYEIAPLLQGGELLLTTGLGLAGVDEASRRHYVRQLAQYGVTAVAIELGRSLADVPEDMVEEAAVAPLPIIALRSVVPFVRVTEAINGAIVDSSIVHLRHADRISQALSERLIQGAGVQRMLETLGDLVDTPVLLLGPDRQAIAAHGLAPELAVQRLPARPGHCAPVPVNGAVSATLIFGAVAPERRALLEAAVERAPTVLALELLRSHHQQTAASRVHAELLRRLLDDQPTSLSTLREHLRAAGLPTERSAFVGVAVRIDDVPLALRTLYTVGQEVGDGALVAGFDGVAVALVSGSGSSLGRPFADAVRRALRAALPPGASPVAAVGPVATHLSSVQHTLREARVTLELMARVPHTDPVVDATSISVERLLHRCADPVLLKEFVLEHLGVLIDSDTRRRTGLVRTLECYLSNGQRKAATARDLHLRRNSLYQRLTRIETLLGTPLDDSHRVAAIVVALCGLRLLGPDAFEHPPGPAATRSRRRGGTTASPTWPDPKGTPPGSGLASGVTSPVAGRSGSAQ